MYQRKFDPSLFLIPQRPNYPLPAYKGLLAQPSWEPITGMPASLLNDAPPPVDTMGGLMGEVGGNSNGGGFGTESDISNRENKGSISYGRASDYNNQVGKHAGRVGSVIGSMAGVPGAGTIAGLAGTGYDLSQVDQNLAQAQTPGLTTGQVLGSLANSVLGFVGNTPNELQDINIQNHWGPNGFDPMASYSYANFSPFGAMGFNDPIGGGEDAFGGWGGYGSQANQGPGADLESEPGDLAAAVADAAAAANSDDSYGTDGAPDNNMGGYGDKGDEAPSGAGDSDEWRHGGLLGDDGDGKFEAVKGTLHENEAVLKPEAVGLLGDDVVTQLNNVASLNDTQKQKLVAGLLDAIIGGKTAKKKTDFRASR